MDDREPEARKLTWKDLVLTAVVFAAVLPVSWLAEEGSTVGPLALAATVVIGAVCWYAGRRGQGQLSAWQAFKWSVILILALVLGAGIIGGMIDA